MKPFLSLALVLTFVSQAPAQAPRMTVREGNGPGKPLHLEQADVAVRFLGDIAETVLDLRFRNDGERAVEGEFVLPLPEGATVSGYALEVNGKLRDGVAVEKKRARAAYDSVKRRMIDPGIVEREAGNTYRTQVYPVPAKGTKRLRISYTETLRPDAQGSAYALPLDFNDSLGSFSCNLRGAAAGAIHISAAAGLDFAADASGVLTATGKDVKPAGTLKLWVTPPAGPQMILENDAQPAFFLSDRVPEIAPRPRPAPAKVLLVWDASGSGIERDHAAELKLLESWFAQLGATRVSLRLLRDRVEDGGEFEISDGRWSKLKKVLKQVDYDGGTALPRLQVTAGQADLVVLISDGVATLGGRLPDVTVPLVFIRCGTGAPPHALVRLARASGGAAIDLATDTQAEALAKLTQQPLRVIAVKGEDIASSVFGQDVHPGQLLRILGTLREPRAGKLELRYGFGNDAIITREVIYQPGGGPDGIVRRLHAQRVLAELEQQDPPDPKQIIDHCKRNGLVSDYTSLIVLERIEDYVENEIPPPEPELRAEFNKQVAMRAKQKSNDSGGLAWAWAVRVHEYEQRLPGYEALLLPRLRQVGIWKKALEAQFAPAQRDAGAFATVAGWFDKGSGLIVRKAQLRTPAEYKAWRQAINELHAQGPTLAKTPLHLPPAGQPLNVSVRGLVVKPGLVAGDPGMTLRQAVDKAGGLHPLGGLDNVALYRNAGKIVYNTLSAHYQDIQLFPGDMVVVGQPEMFSPTASDPFAKPAAPPDPAKEEPIRLQGDLWPAAATSNDPFVPFRSSDNDVSPWSDHRAVPLARTTPSILGGGGAGGGGFATPATPSGRSWRRYSPPGLPSQNSPASDVPPPPPPSASSEIPASPPRKTQATTPAAAESVRSEPPTQPVPPELAAFAKDVAAGHNPAAAYQTLKGGHIYQPDFYVEVARVLFANHQVDLARRVLSNLTELRPGDVATLRSYAYWLAEFGQAAEAAAVLGAVFGDDAAGVQVLLDRASILATSGDTATAADILSAFLERLSPCEAGRLSAVALTEFNGIYPILKAPARPHPLGRVREDYRRNLAADLRIVVSASAPVSLYVVEVGDLPTPDPVGPSVGPCGEQIIAAGGMCEYLLRRAEPGTYHMMCSSDTPATVRAVIHKHWGRPEHTFKVVTLLLAGHQGQAIGDIDFEFQPRRE